MGQNLNLKFSEGKKPRVEPGGGGGGSVGLKKCSPQIFAGKIVVKKILIGKKRRVNPGGGGVERLTLEGGRRVKKKFYRPDFSI